MNSLILITVATIIVLVIFDYTNGFHDASNVIATVIASRAMTPLQAVLVVGFFEFLGPLLGGTAVADTIGSLIDISTLQALPSISIILCGVIAAVTWNIITWRIGIPSSSSHALVGGLIGAVLVSVGSEHIVWGINELGNGHIIGVFKVILALLLSPILGFWVGFIIHRWAGILLRSAPIQVNQKLRRIQFVTTAALAFAHGANDAQKSMGVITLVLLLGGFIPQFQVPFWVVLLCAMAITLGIMSGGWRIVRTVGFGIYKIRPLHAVNAQVTAGLVIFSAAVMGGPVSTTHVVSSSIMGIGASERPRAVRWNKAGDIVSTWIITIPGAAVIAAFTYVLLDQGLVLATGG
ncbi:inorganic phosphate transporter [Mariprofundus sp. EBB-1]|uniref:inorganic phosphate transporter n=1 Tax=Mariprofundus sp. EBB-1 TaxID=2650971 RepID=UPI000EF1E39E|nr:inorganic phosphate transporter [Mariprofundus sp. EBB-1]RLL53008.1 inorganic phosphate transporter [Mariprofundus sp. EBB-1]